MAEITPRAGGRAVLVSRVAFIVALGAAIGIADAFIRPVKLGRSGVTEFALPPVTPVTPANTATTPEGNGGAGNAAVPDVPPATSTTPPANTAATTPSHGGSGFELTPKADLPKGHVTVDEAKAAFDTIAAGGAVGFVDARDKEKFAAGHIPGAVRLALADFLEGVPVKLGLLPREHMVLVYCGGGHCDESERVAEQLEGLGYQQIFIIHDGFPGWQAAGHPVESGEDIE